MREFLRGISAVPAGFRLLAEPGLRQFVWLPIAVNAVVFVALFMLGYAWLQELMAGWLPDPGAIDTGTWWGSLRYALTQLALWLLLPLYLIASAVISFFTFTAVANLVASPFNGMLAARVEEKLTGTMPAAVAERGFTVEAVGAVGDELRKLAYFAAWAVPLLIVTVIPVINLIAAPLWLVYGVWVVTLEYMDYPLGNRGLSFREQRARVRERLLYHAGCGAAILAMTLIPVLNLLAMPTGVIAATVLRVRAGDRADAPATVGEPGAA